MAYGYDALEWSAFLLLFFRSLGICVFAFASINASIFIRASVQVHAVSKGAPCTTRSRSAGPGSNGLATSDRNNTLRPPKAAQTPQGPRSFEHDKFSPPPKQEQKPSHASLMSLYEEIMASDAETIQVQQATIQSQQEVIRSQREMMKKLQQLVEAQDIWIEENMGEANR